MKHIIQFAIVTSNVDDTVQLISDTLNLGPLKVWDFNYPNIFDTTINDEQKPWTMKLAFGWIGNMQFEVIEPKQGASLYKKYLDKYTKPGIQHLLIDREKTSYQDMKSVFVQNGTPIVNEAKSNVAVKMGPFTFPALPMFLAKSMSTVFGYADTLNTLKTVIEISKYTPGIEPRKGIRMGVPTYWSTGNQANFEALPADSLITDIIGFIILVNNINEVKPFYLKSFGMPTSESSLEFVYSGTQIFTQIIQGNMNIAYTNLLNQQGEGVRILIAKPRLSNKAENEKVFASKGFQKISITENATLFVHPNLPFQIQIND